MMMRSRFLAAVVTAAALATAAAADDRAAGVAGSPPKFPPTAEVAVNGKPVSLLLTGTGLRRKLVKVYAIASYVQDDARVQTAEQLIAADTVKRLHLVL